MRQENLARHGIGFSERFLLSFSSLKLVTWPKRAHTMLPRAHNTANLSQRERKCKHCTDRVCNLRRSSKRKNLPKPRMSSSIPPPQPLPATASTPSSGPPPPPAPLPSAMAGGTNPPPPPPSSVAHHVKNESRESSEFEFLGGNGGKSPVRTVPLQGTYSRDSPCALHSWVPGPHQPPPPPRST